MQGTYNKFRCTHLARGCTGVKLVKLDWVTKKAVARHMSRGAIEAKSSVRDCLKQLPKSRNLEL